MGEYNTYNVCQKVGKKCQWVILQTHVYHVFMYLYKVDYMMVNTFMYAVVSLNYNKGMHIIPSSNKVVIIVEH